MARSKRGPALFDLLAGEEAKESTPLQVPGWWRGSETPSGPTGAAIPRRDREVDSLSTDPVDESSAGSTDDTAPFIEFDGGRIRVSFTSVTAAVAVFAFLVVTLGAFEAGRTFGDRSGFKRGAAAGRASYAAETLSEIEAARRRPPTTHLIQNLLNEPNPDTGTKVDGNPTGADSTPPKWIRDYTYVVVQEFSANNADSARRAQAFLDQRGVTTELIRYPSGSIQLITTEGYNRNDAMQRRMADRLLKKIHAIGADYFAQGGGYRLQGYFKTLKEDTW